MNRILYLALLPLMFLATSACKKSACYVDDDGVTQTTKLFSGCGQKTWRLTTLNNKPDVDLLARTPSNREKRFEYTLEDNKYREYTLGARDTVVGQFQVLDQGYAIRTRTKKPNGEYGDWSLAYLIQDAKESRIELETSVQIRVLEPAN
jgi:hypothetical protein